MSLNEKCAVFGAYSTHEEAARITYYGLFGLQHRGQDGSGIAVSNDRRVFGHKGEGLVAAVFSENVMRSLNGAHIAMGHNRYGTSHGERDSAYYLQPVSFYPDLALAHNGNIPCVRGMQNLLVSKGVDVSGKNDSQLMYETIYYFWNKYNRNMLLALREATKYFDGAYSLLMMTNDALYAFRDRHGIRPLSVGHYGENNFVFSSETCAIDTVQAQLVRDVEPGELIEVSCRGMSSWKLLEGNPKLDVFEFVYFARPESYLYGKRVNEVRRRFGQLLAGEIGMEADIVVPVPDSAIPAAEGLGGVMGLPISHALIKNRYIGRTFISPGAHLRDQMANMKYNVITEAVEGKRIVLVDDSIVRLNTMPRLVRRLMSAGSREVHVAVASSPVLFPDFYGIDLARQQDLAAAWKDIEELKEIIGCKSLTYLPYHKMIEAVDVDESMLYTGPFSGKYPIDLGEVGARVSYDVKNKPVLTS